MGRTPEEILGRLETKAYGAPDIVPNPGRASDSKYARRLRDVDAATPARYNDDPDRLFQASSSAGKVAIFAVRLDTFPVEGAEKVFYTGTNDPDILTRLRRHILSR